VQIYHRIVSHPEDPFWLEISFLDLPIEVGALNSVSLAEDDPRWPEVERLVAHYQAADHVATRFAQEELDSAEWLTVWATGHQGYPKPENGYFERTYDPTSCRRCGIHGAQLAPFRFSGEPRSKRIQFLQLHWVYDEFFVRHETRDVLAREGITGIEFGPVLVSRKGEASREASQVKVLHALPPALDVSGLQTVTCVPDNEESSSSLHPCGVDYQPPPLPYCQRVKYHHQKRGCLRFSACVFNGAPDLVKTCEWFGSGGAASQIVIVSQRFHQLVNAQKWRGLAFEPIELIHSPA